MADLEIGDLVITPSLQPKPITHRDDPYTWESQIGVVIDFDYREPNLRFAIVYVNNDNCVGQFVFAPETLKIINKPR